MSRQPSVPNLMTLEPDGLPDVVNWSLPLVNRVARFVNDLLCRTFLRPV
jgi:hypothetical protein